MLKASFEETLGLQRPTQDSSKKKNPSFRLDNKLKWDYLHKSGFAEADLKMCLDSAII